MWRFSCNFVKCDSFVTLSHCHIIFLGSACNKTEFQNLVKSWVLGSRVSNSGLERPSLVLQYVNVWLWLMPDAWPSLFMLVDNIQLAPSDAAFSPARSSRQLSFSSSFLSIIQAPMQPRNAVKWLGSHALFWQSCCLLFCCLPTRNIPENHA